jgi:hypothetical protein
VSSINTTFQPVGPTVALVSGTSVQANAAPSNNLGDCFRIINNSTVAAAHRIAWGRASAVAIPTAAGPQNLLVPASAVIYLCLPADSWFNADASGVFEITPGIGGVGG